MRKKGMKKRVTIEYEWWVTDPDSFSEKIDVDHQEALEESAMDRIVAMMKDGYTSGELHDNVRMHDNDPEDGIEYSGWWSLTTKTL